MDPTLKALIDLLIRAVPTIFFLVLLTVYLKYVFFKPLERVLEKRHQQTEGVRRLAEKALSAAEHKASEFERLLMAAKMDLYREQEAQRHRWLTEQSRTLADARRHAEERIEETRRELAVEIERATTEMAAQARELAKQMIASVLRRAA
jgi:F0F1-type ATP synthase membrane subunit b/b'